MQLDKSSHRFLRICGKILGAFPVWYAKRLEDKLLDEDEVIKR